MICNAKQFCFQPFPSCIVHRIVLWQFCDSELGEAFCEEAMLVIWENNDAWGVETGEGQLVTYWVTRGLSQLWHKPIVCLVSWLTQLFLPSSLYVIFLHPVVRSDHYSVFGNVLTHQPVCFWFMSSCSWALKQTLFPKTVSGVVHLPAFYWPTGSTVWGGQTMTIMILSGEGSLWLGLYHIDWKDILVLFFNVYLSYVNQRQR